MADSSSLGEEQLLHRSGDQGRPDSLRAFNEEAPSLFPVPAAEQPSGGSHPRGPFGTCSAQLGRSRALQAASPS